MTSIKAAVFDMGGVFLKYPDPGFLDRIMKLGESLVYFPIENISKGIHLIQDIH